MGRQKTYANGGCHVIAALKFHAFLEANYTVCNHALRFLCTVESGRVRHTSEGANLDLEMGDMNYETPG